MTEPGHQGHLTKTDWVVETLRSEILRSDLSPGSSLQQEDVARRLGVSSTPVREAFVQLEAQGLVEKRPHHGVVVARRNADELVDVYEMRMLLEPRAFARAARRLTPATIDALDACIEDAARELARPDIQASRRANSRFHEILVDASGSETYSEIVRSLIHRSLFVIPVDVSVLHRITENHRDIAANLRAGNLDPAIRLMREHLKDMNGMFKSGAVRSARSGGQISAGE